MNKVFALPFFLIIIILIIVSGCKKEGNQNTACFTINRDSINVFDTLVCFNCTVQADSFYYTFGDGQYSTDTNPKHIYNSPGNYIVWLIIKEGGNKDSVSKNVFVSNNISGTSQIYNPYYGQGQGCNDSIVFFSCSTCSDPLNFYVWLPPFPASLGHMNSVYGFDFNYTVTGFGIIGSGNFSSDLKSVTIHYSTTTHNYGNDFPIINYCDFTGTRK